MGLKRRMIGVFTVGWFVSCAPQPPAQPPAAKKPAETVAAEPTPDPLPEIRSAFVGEQSVVRVPAMEAHVQFSGVLGEQKVIALGLDEDWRHRALKQSGREAETKMLVPQVGVKAPHARTAFVSLDDSDPTEEQMRSSAGPPDSRDTIWVHGLPEKGEPTITLLANFSPDDPSSPLVEIPIEVRGSTEPAQADARNTWGRALGRHMAGYTSIELGRFFARRLHEVFGRTDGREMQADRQWSLSTHSSDMSELVDLFSGHRSVERALEYRQSLSTQERTFEPRRKIAELTKPQARPHNWKAMLRGLTTRSSIPALSKSVPAEFYFLHAKSGASFFQMMDELESFLSPAHHLLNERFRHHGIAERYKTMLGLQTTALAKVLGPHVIDEVAIVGSDPFLRLGSDVTVILKASDPKVLAVGLEAALVQSAEGHAGLKSETIEISGHQVRRSQTADGKVNRLVWRDKQRFIISNSPGALTRVMATIEGKHRPLSAESDFKYMIHRDPRTDVDVLAYAGDRFIETVVSPQSRILDARRNLAHGELRRVGMATVLSELFEERTSDPEALKTTGLLKKHEVRHFDGQKIQQGPRSAWGRPSHMVPLIDLPAVDKITEAEAEGYDRFVREYNRNWGTAIDPIALRLKLSPEKKGFEAHLRVLPLVNDREYSQFLDLVGKQRISFQGPALGIQFVLAMAEDGSFRREMSQLSRSVAGERVKFDWLGAYAFGGIEDHPDVANQLYFETAPGPREGDGPRNFDAILGLPLYAGVEIRSQAGAELALSAAKLLVSRVDDVRWLEKEEHAGVTIEGVQIPRSEFTIFYALGKKTLFFTLKKRTMKRLIDLEAEGQLPKGTDKGRAQLGWETRQKPGAGISTLLAWAFESELQDERSSALFSELLGLARDHSTLSRKRIQNHGFMMDMLGEAPLTVDGFFYEDGGLDPHRGTRLRRKWPALPVVGSYIDAVLGNLEVARMEVGFDEEVPQGPGDEHRSLSVHVTVQRDGPSRRRAPVLR